VAATRSRGATAWRLRGALCVVRGALCVVRTQLELQLGEVTRCRTLYQKYLQWAADNCQAWISFAELEASIGELDRARAIFGLAINQVPHHHAPRCGRPGRRGANVFARRCAVRRSAPPSATPPRLRADVRRFVGCVRVQPTLDMPETLWKAYIDFEISQGEHERTRTLYRQLLSRTTHVKARCSPTPPLPPSVRRPCRRPSAAPAAARPPPAAQSRRSPSPRARHALAARLPRAAAARSPPRARATPPVPVDVASWPLWAWRRCGSRLRASRRRQAVRTRRR
jgi:crooked neck